MIWKGGPDGWCTMPAKKKDLSCSGRWGKLGDASKQAFSLYAERHRTSYQASYHGADPQKGNERYNVYFDATTNADAHLVRDDKEQTIFDPRQQIQNRDQTILNLRQQIFDLQQQLWAGKGQEAMAGHYGPVIGKGEEKGYGPVIGKGPYR